MATKKDPNWDREKKTGRKREEEQRGLRQVARKTDPSQAAQKPPRRKKDLAPVAEGSLPQRDPKSMQGKKEREEGRQRDPMSAWQTDRMAALGKGHLRRQRR
jgi:hypothetical protein